MSILIGGLLAMLAVVTFILPVVSFFRARRAHRLVEDMRGRVETLERTVARLMAAIEPPSSPQPASRPETDHTRSRPRAAAARSADLEQLIGGSWLLYAGIAAVVLGMTYFVKFAFDNGWISERLRVAAGGAAGALLVASGIRFWSRGLALFGQALAGGGIVVFYVAIYAALHLYDLVNPAPAFALMAIVTGAAAYLANQQRAQPLAALALVGGFATPLLVGHAPHTDAILFTYIAILIAGSTLLAHRHAWPLVSGGAYLCTGQLVVMWFFASYDAEDWLQVELFLTLYAALFGYVLWTLLRSNHRSLPAQLATALLATAPLAYHLASLILLNEHPGPWIVYLVLVTVAALVVSQRAGAAWLRLAALVLVGLPALAWLGSLRFPRWYAPGVMTVLVLYGMHLASQWQATTAQDGTTEASPIETIHAQANGLLLPLSLFLFLEGRFPWWNPWMVAALSAWNAGLALVARSQGWRMVLQFVATSATLAAVALVLFVDGSPVAVGWAAEGALLGWLAVRERSRWLGIGSGLLVAMGCVQLAFELAAPLPVGETPLFNSRALAAALVIGLLAWLASRMRVDAAAAVRGPARHAVIITAHLLALGLLSAEIHAYFSQHAAAVDSDTTLTRSTLAEQVTLSVAWALYAVALIAAGIRRHYAPARYLAIGLFAVTILKVLISDIADLDRLNRMLSVLGVGVLLLIASYLYQRTAVRTGGDRT